MQISHLLYLPYPLPLYLISCHPLVPFSWGFHCDGREEKFFTLVFEYKINKFFHLVLSNKTQQFWEKSNNNIRVHCFLPVSFRLWRCCRQDHCCLYRPQCPPPSAASASADTAGGQAYEPRPSFFGSGQESHCRPLASLKIYAGEERKNKLKLHPN